MTTLSPKEKEFKEEEQYLSVLAGRSWQVSLVLCKTKSFVLNTTMGLVCFGME